MQEQIIQETAVKIELMEKRAEGVKKQSEALADLESELARSKKTEESLESTIDQLREDLGKLELEAAKLRQAVPVEKTGEHCRGSGVHRRGPFADARR